MELTYVTQRSYVSSYPQVMDKGRWFGAQLSLRSGLAWPAYVSGEKLGNLFLSWKNMYHVARILGIQSRVGESLTRPWFFIDDARVANYESHPRYSIL